MPARLAGWAARLAGRACRIGDLILDAPPRITTALLIGYGALLILFSLLLGLDQVDWRGRGCARVCEVDFLAAPNWSLTAIVLWPAMFYVLRSVLASVDQVFADMDESPMAWLRAHPTRERIASTWRSNRRILELITVLAFVVGIGAALYEWWTNSLVLIRLGHVPLEAEADWSSIPGAAENGGALAQGAFSLLAFLYQGVAVGLMLTFAAAIVLIARVVGLHGTGAASPPLLIDIESNDPSSRVGFERFMVIIDYMTLFVGLAFVNFFLTRIQNAYLSRSELAPAALTSLADFLRQDLSLYQVDQNTIAQLFNSELDDFSSIAVAIGAVIGLFQCFFFFNATLRHSAMFARNRSDHELVRGAPLEKARETGLEVATIRERLRGANVWPLGYSDLLPTLSFLVIALTTIIFYRIGIYLVFLWIAGWILSRTAAGLIRRS